jgi:D-glycero-beta-D-manno-heptose-7-phosphate kinase
MIGMERARELVAAFGRQRILVVGDAMLDLYIYGAVERISPEAPVPVVRVRRERKMPGGAANVAVNIRALGGASDLAGVVGKDSFGADLADLLKAGGIGVEGVMPLSGARTTVKMRILAERQQVVRVDWEDEPAIPPPLTDAMCRKLRRLAGAATGIIIADYRKGMVSQAIVDAVLSVARRRGVPVGLDPKDNTHLKISGLTLATPNYKEALACACLPPKAAPDKDPLADESLRKAGAILLKKWALKQLIVTLGPQGMYLVSPRRPARVIPTRAREVFDVSGAGDTVIATCLLALAAGADGMEAAALGNSAAGVVVGKVGTASCSPSELLECVARG